MGVFILGGSRTPFGSFLGPLSEIPAVRLGAVAIEGAIKNSNINREEIQEVFMGHVIQAGCGQAPARQAALGAQLKESVPCTTINKVCGSGLKSVISGAQSILTDHHDLVVSGGMENMSLAPFLLPSGRTGHKFGSVEMKDSMQWDGLWDVYSQRAMGSCAEECARKYNFSRQAQDEFAQESFVRAQNAQKLGIFSQEISAVTIKSKKGDILVTEDDGPGRANFEKMKTLSPAFERDGSITAANASTINDGAAALVLGGSKYESMAEFEILSWASFATNPTWFTTAPVGAMQMALKKASLEASEIEAFEINEAFAVVVQAAMKEMNLNHKLVNQNGGAISLGHPIGASGTRIVLSLMSVMRRNSVKYGMASVCIGGGEALAMVIKRCRT